MTTEIALEKVALVIEDLLMLQEGTWVPDRKSCQSTLDNLEDIQNYLRSIAK